MGKEKQDVVGNLPPNDIKQSEPAADKYRAVVKNKTDNTILIKAEGPTKEIAEKATTEGIKTLPEFMNIKLSQSIKKNYGLAKIVTANNAFAHMDDLIGMLKSINNLLDPNGIFVFELLLSIIISIAAFIISQRIKPKYSLSIIFAGLIIIFVIFSINCEASIIEQFEILDPPIL